MITLSKIKSSAIENSRRILKVLQFGPKTAKEASPFGFDSCPIEGVTAIFAETSNADESVIVGYIQDQRTAPEGATRIFSVDPVTKELRAEIYLKTDGSIRINQGTEKAVLYGPLVDILEGQKNDINTEFTKIQAAILALGGTYSAAPINIDPAPAQSENIFLK